MRHLSAQPISTEAEWKIFISLSKQTEFRFLLPSALGGYWASRHPLHLHAVRTNAHDKFRVTQTNPSVYLLNVFS